MTEPNTTQPMSPEIEDRLLRLATRLVDQERAHVLISPNQPSFGYWFGGGNLHQTPSGSFVLSGRYRNAGDSRTGVGAGVRGLEYSIFEGPTFAGPFKKIRSWSKADFSSDAKPVISFEGSALRFTHRFR